MSNRAELAASIERNKVEAPLCITATCPGCDRIVAGHVVDRAASSHSDIGSVAIKALDGYRIEIICGPVLISPCRCEP